MLILALDSSTPAVTAAVADGDRVLAEFTTVDARRHAEILAPAVREVLARAGADRRDLGAIAVGVGPGPFTGLRVALVTGAVLGAALDVPVHGFCSLDVLAARLVADVAGPQLPQRFLVATDARRREVYWAAYAADPARPGGVRREGEPQVAAPDAVRGLAAGRPVTGPALDLYPALAEAGPPLPSPAMAAGALARLAAATLAAGDAGMPLRPLYLRRPDAREPGPRKPVLR